MSGCHHDHHDGTGKTVAFNLSVNILLTAGKWFAFALTGSPSIFGEAAHSSADTLNPILLWIGHKLGKRPPCKDHPYGHGRETFFWALIAAIVMLVLGACLTAWHGLKTLITGQAPEHSLVSLGIMGFAFLMEMTTLTMAWRRLQKERGHGLFDRLKNSRNSVILGVLLENGVDALGVTLAFMGFGLYLLTGNPYWDAAFSLAIAATLTVSSMFLIRKNRSLLTGQSAQEHVNPIRDAVIAAHPAIRDVTEMIVIALGPEDFMCRMTIRLDHEWHEIGSYAQSSRALISLLCGIRETVLETEPHVRQVDIEIENR